MKWKEPMLIDYLITRSGCEATMDDIFEHFGVNMTNSNIANFRSCLKYMTAIEIRYRRQKSFLQTICQANIMIAKEKYPNH